MEQSFAKLLNGYSSFREKYASGDQSIMQQLAQTGQQPEVMVVSCCDSRVDPALILQSDPGELFIVRNVANIVPPYENDDFHHGTSAALEFGVRFLNVKHLILLGHSQCGGIQALMDKQNNTDDFITKWVSLMQSTQSESLDNSAYAKLALKKSRENCLSFPWLKNKFNANELNIHLWFFDIKLGEIFQYSAAEDGYLPLHSRGGL